jgi:membrane-bound lytic murein transglycosylase B
MTAVPARNRWLLPVATIALGLLGAGLIVTSVLLPESGSSVVAAPSSVPSASPTATVPARGGSPATGPGSAASGISSLPDAEWVERVSVEAGIPARALAAYAGAALSVAQEQPGCELGWNTLAGIGLVESGHGTISGGAIGDDGIATPPIIGIPLDGNGVEAIADTDEGVVDTDTTWDRAVGPMQFIPATWAQFGRDGDGDKEKDVHDIEDAALSAAEYLCVGGVSLGDPAGWITAIHSYNPSVDYNNRVAAAAEQYASIG